MLSWLLNSRGDGPFVWVMSRHVAWHAKLMLSTWQLMLLSTHANAPQIA